MKFINESELESTTADITKYLNRFFDGKLTSRAVAHILGPNIPINIENSMRALYTNNAMKFDVIKAMIVYHYTRLGKVRLSYKSLNIVLRQDFDWFFIKDIFDLNNCVGINPLALR